MHKYCLDTSGISNPIMDLPEDVHVTLWQKVQKCVTDGLFCWNKEISKELDSIYGQTGDCLRACNGSCCYEVGSGSWAWQGYITTFDAMRLKYTPYISEYNGNRKDTVGINDVSIISFAKAMNLPLLSMERPNRGQPSQRKMRIPDVCAAENVKHMNFTEFLRAEGIKI